MSTHPEKIKEYIRSTADMRGDGFIGFVEMKLLLQKLVPHLSDTAFLSLAQSSGACFVKYSQLIDGIFGKESVCKSTKTCLEEVGTGLEGPCKDHCKQGKFSSTSSSSFKFDSSLDRALPLKIDVYEPMGSSGTVSKGLGLGENRITIKSSNGSTPEMALTFAITEDTESAQTVQSKRERVTEDVHGYLAQHGIMDSLQNAVKMLLKERPDSPHVFLSQFLANSQPSAAQKKTERLNTQTLFTLPEIPVKKKVRVLDFGSGEIGLYTYEVSQDDQVYTTGTKIPFTLFAYFVEACKVEEFCSELIKHLALQPGCEDKIDLFGGATGVHRDMLQSEVLKRQKILEFFEKVERCLEVSLSCPVRLRVFVPSGLLEAQFELRATDWLVQQSQVQITGLESACSETMLFDVYEDFAISRTNHGSASIKCFQDFCEEVRANNALALSFVRQAIFRGTLSAGGGSTQLSMLGGSGVLQLFSMPVGNRIPIIGGMFSRPVLPAERSAWAERIHTSLTSAGFPQQLRGLYVGISAMFYAAKGAGINDRILVKGEVVHALGTTLDACDPEDQRTIAGLMLAYAVVQFVFDESACFLFKRNWECGDTTYVATWTLGFFTEQLAQSSDMRRPKRNLWKKKVDAIKATKILSGASPVHISDQRTLEEPSACKLPDNPFEVPDDLFEVPLLDNLWSGQPSVLLDFGSGEIGFYCYLVDLSERRIKVEASSKCGKPLYDHFVANSKVEEFCDEFVQRVGSVLEKLLTQNNMLLVAGGATGLHRDMLREDPQRRTEILTFLSYVETEIQKRLHRDVDCRVFVPSGELEAQFELRATAWLVQQARVDVGNAPLGLQEYFLREAFHGLAGSDGLLTLSEAESLLLDAGVQQNEIQRAFNQADLDLSGSLDFAEFRKSIDANNEVLARILDNAQFRGTLSAGGGSSQLAVIAASNAAHSMQMYSAPVGNRVPFTAGMFSKPITIRERSMWVQRIHEAFINSRIPRGIEGLFVGISATYHAAKKAGIDDRIIGKKETVVALARALDKLGPEDSRDMANLILVKELVDWAFDDSASFLFKRNWQIGGAQYTASWTFGWYISQFEGDANDRSVSSSSAAMKQ